MRQGMIALGLLLAAVLCGGCGDDDKPEEKKLYLYTWSEYFTDKAKAGFKAKTGYEVVEDNYASPEDMLAKLKTGGAEYDVVVATDYILVSLIRDGLIEPIDAGKVPNKKNIARRFENPSYDPGNKHCVPYLWGTVGIGVNIEKVKEKVDSWRVLWDEKYKGRISMPDSARDCLGIAFKLEGRSFNEKDPAAIQAAAARLKAQKPHVKTYSSDFKPLLESAEVWLVAGWSGDILQLAREYPDRFRYVIPKEGGEIWVDSLCVPKASKHKDVAHQFLNYILEPEVHAEISSARLYPCPNEAAMKHIPEAQRKDPDIYPPDEALRNCELLESLGPEVDKLYLKAWTEVKGEE